MENTFNVRENAQIISEIAPLRLEKYMVPTIVLEPMRGGYFNSKVVLCIGKEYLSCGHNLGTYWMRREASASAFTLQGHIEQVGSTTAKTTNFDTLAQLVGFITDLANK